VTYSTSDGSYTVNSGSTIVMRFKALQDDTVAAQAKVLAQRYMRHCYIGRANTRTEDRGSFIFDYWRDPSGQNPPIPGEDDICSNYNRNNLTVEDMGGGDGWRVRTTTTYCTWSTTAPTPTTATWCWPSTATSANSATPMVVRTTPSTI
jgi:hypothetical protein